MLAKIRRKWEGLDGMYFDPLSLFDHILHHCEQICKVLITRKTIYFQKHCKTLRHVERTLKSGDGYFFASVS